MLFSSRHIMPVSSYRNVQGRSFKQLLIVFSGCQHKNRHIVQVGKLAVLESYCKSSCKNQLYLVNNLPHKGALNYRFLSTSQIKHGGLGYKLKDNIKDCCSLLNVSEDCSIAELKEAYIEKAKLYHPDSSSSTADAKKFEQVKEAYQTIKAKLDDQAALEGLYPEEEEEEELFFTKLQPQHRQYLDNEGIGFGTRQERQKQYEQFRLSKAQNKVYDYTIKRLTPQGENALVAKDQRAARRNKIRSDYELNDRWLKVQLDRKRNSMDRMVEDLIQEAMSRGDFKDLTGFGKPLKYEQDTPYMDKITKKLNQILINESTQPEWIMLQKEIRTDLEHSRQKLAIEVKQLGEQPYKGDNLKHWNLCASQFQTTLGDINTKIDKFNLICPVLSKQMIPYKYTRECDRICQNPDRFLPPDFALRSKGAEAKQPVYMYQENASMKQIWSDFKDIFRKSKNKE